MSNLKDVLILRSRLLLPQQSLNNIRNNILSQIDSGVVLLPDYMDVEIVQVPDDIEVRFEGQEGY